jgi:hypothetical protein
MGGFNLKSSYRYLIDDEKVDPPIKVGTNGIFNWRNN